MTEIADVVGVVLGDIGFEKPEMSERACANGCGAAVRGAGPTWCRACLESAEARDAAREERNAIADALASIPTEWRWASIDDPSFAVRVRGADRFRTMALAAYPFPGGVTITGAAARGKTSAACAIFRLWVLSSGPTQSADLASRASSRFVSARSLPRMIALAQPERMEALIGAGIVLLDDLGSEGDMPHAKTAVADLIAERHAWGRPTIVTTHLDVAEVVVRYGDGVARRLFDASRVFRVNLGN